MNYTENYHLPQWEETDRIMRTDFNGAMADIEEGLTQNAQDAAEAAGAAQTTANSALSKANAAQTTANKAYSPSYKPYTTGTYNGNGPGNSQSVSVGFKPTFLLIGGQPKDTSTGTTHAFLVGEGILSNVVTLTSTGFTINGQSGSLHVRINDWDTKYRYLAFR